MHSDKPRPSRSRRSAQDVIDQAIRENRVWEYTCLGLTLAFGLTGVGTMVAGAARDSGIMALSGSLAGVWLWPLLRFAGKAWDQNRRIRLLELSLSRAGTCEEAALVIHQLLHPTPPTGGSRENEHGEGKGHAVRS